MNAAVAAKMPQREFATKNRISGPRSSPSLSSGWMGGFAGACIDAFPMDFSPSSRLHAGDRGGEIARHERLEGGDPLADPAAMHPQAKTFRDPHPDAPARP